MLFMQKQLLEQIKIIFFINKQARLFEACGVKETLARKSSETS